MSIQDFERLRVKNNKMCITRPKIENFERWGVNLLSYIEKRNRTVFERSRTSRDRISSHLESHVNKFPIAK